MKILVVSLLRLGDVILGTPVLKGYREKYPDAKIDLLINEQFSQIKDLLPFVNEIIPFKRDALQKSLGEPDRSFFESFDRLDHLITDLNSRNYDLLVNLTHNRLSGWLSALISADKKLGLQIDANGRPTFGSAWFRYLNDYVSEGGANPLHYVDVFCYGAGLDAPLKSLYLSESKDNQSSIQHIVNDTPKYFVVQALTSDSKKTWSRDRLLETLKILSTLQPGLTPVLIGAPNEADVLNGIVEKLAAKQVRAKVAICSLAEAYSILKRAKFCLTGDTSIKHLAAAAAIPVIELSLGSSQYLFTGVYAENCLIIQSKEACAPCIHSSACHRENHACAQRVSAELVAMTCDALLRRDWGGLKVIAREFSDEAELLRTTMVDTGYWTAIPLVDEFGRGSIAKWIDRSSWKMLLEGEHERRVGGFGSESRGIQTAMSAYITPEKNGEWLDVLAGIERDLSAFEARIEIFLKDLRIALGHFKQGEAVSGLSSRLKEFGTRETKDPLLASHARTLVIAAQDPVSSEFGRIKKIREALTDVHNRTSIELKLVKALRGQQGVI